ncbi:MAG: 23S rRNA (pseudouridine(1915)-N(3))-methyltransferase RlmH [Bdellovibrionales bacterium]
MKLKFFIFETKAPAWVEAARQEYAVKLASFVTFELQSLKSPSADREQAEFKRRKEAEILLNQIDHRDLLILFDENGKRPPDSEAFATWVARVMESGKARIVFCIGGPYGFADDVLRRSQERWSLSPLTMNHWVAQVSALEQLYRAFTIFKGLPYHNR